MPTRSPTVAAPGDIAVLVQLHEDWLFNEWQDITLGTVEAVDDNGRATKYKPVKKPRRAKSVPRDATVLIIHASVVDVPALMAAEQPVFRHIGELQRWAVKFRRDHKP